MQEVKHSPLTTQPSAHTEHGGRGNASPAQAIIHMPRDLKISDDHTSIAGSASDLADANKES